MLLFWVVTLFRLVIRYQRFGGIYCLHLQDLGLPVPIRYSPQVCVIILELAWCCLLVSVRIPLCC